MARPATPIPLPRLPINVRLATAGDIPFIDGLQRIHTKQVGWMPTAQFEGKIKLGHVLVAEARDEETERRRDEVIAEERDEETERRRDEVKDQSDALAHSVSSSL